MIGPAIPVMSVPAGSSVSFLFFCFLRFLILNAWVLFHKFVDNILSGKAYLLPSLISFTYCPV